VKQVESQSHLNIFQLKTPVRAGAIDAKTIRDSVNDFEVGDTIFRGCQYEIFGVGAEHQIIPNSILMTQFASNE